MLPRLLLALAVTTTALLAPLPAGAEPGTPPAAGAARAAPPWTSPLGDPPLVGRPFQPPPHPFGAGHRGVDLVGRSGDPVVAAGDGTVVFAGMVAGRPVVSVDHAGGLRTTYEPVDPWVSAGQRVGRGDPIGALVLGHGGCPAPACLHWGLRRGEDYLDPLSVLRPPRVRLLPIAPFVPDD